uniref:Predicted protein n=1 Tax=Physcomitrium patens TaxID=3218 RepID=A9U5P0_PHYPA
MVERSVFTNDEAARIRIAVASAAWVEAVAVSAEVKENSEEVLKVDPRVPYIVLLKGLVETMKWRSRRDEFVTIAANTYCRWTRLMSGENSNPVTDELIANKLQVPGRNGCSGGQGRNVAAQSSSHTGDCGGDTQITNRATRGPLQLDGNETLPLE